MKRFRIPLMDVNGQLGSAEIEVQDDAGIGQIVDLVRAELKDPTGNVWIGWPEQLDVPEPKIILMK